MLRKRCLCPADTELMAEVKSNRCTDTAVIDHVSESICLSAAINISYMCVS